MTVALYSVRSPSLDMQTSSAHTFWLHRQIRTTASHTSSLKDLRKMMLRCLPATDRTGHQPGRKQKHLPNGLSEKQWPEVLSASIGQPTACMNRPTYARSCKRSSIAKAGRHQAGWALFWKANHPGMVNTNCLGTM